jgi:hypothetical protein
MRPITPYGTDARHAPQPLPLQPAPAPKLSADPRPGHPRNATDPKFVDWALL